MDKFVSPLYKIKHRMKFIDITNKKAAEIIGVTPENISRTLTGKIRVSKPVAYCVTKLLNSEAEIEDYFERVK